MPRQRSKHAAKHFSWVEKYLKELRRTGNKEEACRRAGICRDTPWAHRKRSDEFRRRETEIVDRLAVETGKTHHRRSAKGAPLEFMWLEIRSKVAHECIMCGDTIPAGGIYWAQRNIHATYTSGGEYSHRYCQECQPHYRKPQ